MTGRLYGVTDHPGGYAGALADFYEECAARLAAHLDAGRDVVLLAEGDPLFYGSYMYMHDRLAPRYETEIVPSVLAFAATRATLVLHLAVTRTRALMAEIEPHYGPDCPGGESYLYDTARDRKTKR